MSKAELKKKMKLNFFTFLEHKKKCDQIAVVLGQRVNEIANNVHAKSQQNLL